jgi:cell division GTPase FtsZ
MLNRRQFNQSCLSALAAASWVSAAQASSLADPALRQLAAFRVALPTTVEPSSATAPKVSVIGVGGGGCSAARHMVDDGVAGIEFIFIDTDTSALEVCAPHKSIQLKTMALNTGTVHGQSRSSAELAAHEIRSALNGTHLLFITVGMGGGTGTDAAPVIARIAKEMGIETVALVTMPFGWEGPRRMHYAEIGLAKLKSHLKVVIALPNDKLLEVMGGYATVDDFSDHANEVMKNAVVGIAEIFLAEPEDPTTALGMEGQRHQDQVVIERKLASHFLKIGVF